MPLLIEMMAPWIGVAIALVGCGAGGLAGPRCTCPTDTALSYQGFHERECPRARPGIER